jgi:anti-anti-sigma factor
MNFEVKHIDDITIFKLNERKMDTTISGLLKGEFTILCQTENIRKLIIDLEKVELCDSSGLSALLLAQRQIREKGGAIRLINVNEKVHNLIKISFLENVLPVCNSLEEAFEELENLE